MDYELIKPDKDDAYDPAPFLNYARARRTDREERDPDVGDSVHFWDGTDCRAAIVGGLSETFGKEPTADLMVLWFDLESGLHWGQALDTSHSEAKRISTWHWPCGGH